MEELKNMVELRNERVASLIKLIAENQGNTPNLPPKLQMKFPNFNGNSDVDVGDWLCKCEEYFRFDSMDDVRKVRVASTHLESKARSWHQVFERRRVSSIPLGWQEYKLAITARFRDTHFDPMDEILALRQTSVVSYNAVISKNRDATLGALQLFDEMPEPALCSNPCEVCISEDEPSQTCENHEKKVGHECLALSFHSVNEIQRFDACVISEEKVDLDAEKVFDELPDPILCSHVHTIEDEYTPKSETIKVQADYVCLDSSFHCVVGRDVVLKQQIGCFPTTLVQVHDVEVNERFEEYKESHFESLLDGVADNVAYEVVVQNAYKFQNVKSQHVATSYEARLCKTCCCSYGEMKYGLMCSLAYTPEDKGVLRSGEMTMMKRFRTKVGETTLVPTISDPGGCRLSLEKLTHHVKLGPPMAFSVTLLAWLYRTTNNGHYLQYAGNNAVKFGGTDSKHAGLQILPAKLFLYEDGHNLHYTTSASFLLAVYSNYLALYSLGASCLLLPESIILTFDPGGLEHNFAITSPPWCQYMVRHHPIVWIFDPGIRDGRNSISLVLVASIF